MQIKRSLLAAVLGVSCGLAGCKDDRANSTPTGGNTSNAPAASSSNPVGTVDMGQVFDKLAYTQAIDTKIQQYANALQQQVNQIQAGYNTDILNYIKKLDPNFKSGAGEQPKLSQDQIQQVNYMSTVVQNTMRQLAQTADQYINEYRTAYVREYRVELASIVRQVAQEKKFNVIVTGTDNVVFYSDSALDLTNAVVDASRSHPFTPAEVPLKALPVPQQGLNPATQPTAPTVNGGKTPATNPAK